MLVLMALCRAAGKIAPCAVLGNALKTLKYAV
jgi:hypothetical protein